MSNSSLVDECQLLNSVARALRSLLPRVNAVVGIAPPGDDGTDASRTSKQENKLIDKSIGVGGRQMRRAEKLSQDQKSVEFENQWMSDDSLRSMSPELEGRKRCASLL